MSNNRKFVLAAAIAASSLLAGAAVSAPLPPPPGCFPVVGATSAPVAKSAELFAISCTVPTTSHEGLIVLTGLLTVVGAFMLRRRDRT